MLCAKGKARNEKIGSLFRQSNQSNEHIVSIAAKKITKRHQMMQKSKGGEMQQNYFQSGTLLYLRKHPARQKKLSTALALAQHTVL